jgi:simple sugar transport system ATP-binding protein
MTDLDVREVTEPPKADVPMLEIRDVTKRFGSVISLFEISTTVRAGQSPASSATTAPASRR